MNVLITSASREVDLVRSFQWAIAQEGQGKVTTVDASPRAAALYYADDHYIVPPSDKPEFLLAILGLCKKLNIKLLISPRDEELLLLAENKEEFASIGTFVMVPEPDTIKTCQDKKLFIEFCIRNGFAIPKTYQLVTTQTQTSDDVEFPVFAKPRRGKGGRQALRINSREEFELALKQMPDAIIQEFIQAPEYTVDLFSDFSGRVISVVPRERILIFGGESFIGRTSKNHLLMRENIRLATKLGLIGHNTIQCFLEGDVVKFIEVNPRFGGGAHLGFAAGAHTPHFLVKLVKGETLEPRIGDFRNNYVMLRYTQDLFINAKSLSKRMLP